MSNKIDFYQAEQDKLTVPAGRVSVFVEGVLCPYLEPMEIVRGGWPEFSWARLMYNRTAYLQANQESTGQILAKLAPGKRIHIQQIYNDLFPSVSVCGLPVFLGRIQQVDTLCSGDNQSVEIVAKDFSAELERVTVYGQRAAKTDSSTVLFTGLDTVFNENGVANASTSTIEKNGCSYTVFCPERSQARVWSYAEAIDYLLCEYIPLGQLARPGLEQLAALTENQIARDLDVTGLSLSKALHICCERIGLRFRLVPSTLPTGPQQTIVFYRNGRGRAVELNLQAEGQQLSISSTSIARIDSRKKFFPITHRYIGQGDFKGYEASFDLVKAWDPAGESIDYDTFAHSTNPDF